MIRTSSDVITDGTSEIVLRVSCVLSILGSLLVILACSLPDSVRKKKGRQLIFWLSLTDLGTAVVYLISTFESSQSNTPQCKTLALLGIFFPVSSFLWTDFIAMHIFMVITSRRLKTDKEWDRIMMYFHLITWGVSTACITLVAAFDHAGRNEHSDSGNTGGWCWVQTSDPGMLIWWELIGGKFVEWTSCFILLPLLYLSTAATLVKLDRMHGTSSGQQSAGGTSFAISLLSLLRSGSRPPSAGTDDCQGQTATSGDTTALTRAMRHDKFRKFYMKMALVPVLFCFVRIWGSLRVFIYAVTRDSSSAASAADRWLFLMQAIFDPSQGFFNAVIFVFLSARDLHNLKMLVRMSWPVVALLGPMRSVDTTVSLGRPGAFQMQESISAINMSEFGGASTAGSMHTASTTNATASPFQHHSSVESCVMTDGVSESASTMRGSEHWGNRRPSFGVDNEF